MSSVSHLNPLEVFLSLGRQVLLSFFHSTFIESLLKTRLDRFYEVPLDDPQI